MRGFRPSTRRDRVPATGRLPTSPRLMLPIDLMDLSRADFSLLLSLEALLAERNVSRAATRLGLSQPALSAQLARLREMFGDPLLVATARGMVPPPRAEAI